MPPLKQNKNSRAYFKVLNYYCNPERKRTSLTKLFRTISKIQRAEPGIVLLISGDFNQNLL